MIKELSRLILGLVIVGFHRQIADFILVKETALCELLSRRGWNMPSFPSKEVAHDVYFVLGLFVCCLSLVRLWLLS